MNRPALGCPGSQTRAWIEYRAQVRESAARPCELEVAAEIWPAEYKAPCGKCRSCLARKAMQDGEA